MSASVDGVSRRAFLQAGAAGLGFPVLAKMARADETFARRAKVEEIANKLLVNPDKLEVAIGEIQSGKRRVSVVPNLEEREIDLNNPAWVGSHAKRDKAIETAEVDLRELLNSSNPPQIQAQDDRMVVSGYAYNFAHVKRAIASEVQSNSSYRLNPREILDSEVRDLVDGPEEGIVLTSLGRNLNSFRLYDISIHSGPYTVSA